ncbi:MBL fold metallo-hydrolase [Bilifractor sp. LCP19S3_H10]|uniref:MBL fold metallo-hydrolase n=1 Tax=Bilifractor sp. LCP19S3_H10 TaxID=3438736 RepID=UPI003F90F61D
MSEMEVQSMVLGMVQTNVYLVKNKKTGELLVVDPADSPDRIARKIGEMDGKPAAILLTHGHFDHIGACAALRAKYGIMVYAEEHEREVLTDPTKNLSASWASPVTAEADRYVKDGDILRLAGFEIHVYHTPGHTKGSCCYYFPEEKALFSGDTLFCESYGRTDLPTGSSHDMEESVRRILREIPPDTAVYTGHEMFTTIARERKYNPLAR